MCAAATQIARSVTIVIAVNRQFRGAVLPSPRIATATERDRLEKFRARPAPALEPTPRGTITTDLKKLGEKSREIQIRRLNQRLYSASGDMRRDRLKAVNKGRAKAGFNQKSKSQER